MLNLSSLHNSYNFHILKLILKHIKKLINHFYKFFLYIKKVNTYYQKHNERLQKETSESYQNLSKDEKDKKVKKDSSLISKSFFKRKIVESWVHETLLFST